MASPSSDSRRSQMQRRDSSPRNTSKRRPRLLRASATEPSITTSCASRNALASSQSSRRATDILNRVAVVSGSPPDSMIRATSPLSSPTPLYESLDQQGDLSSSPNSSPGAFDDFHPYSDRYVSFPSFDIYEVLQQDEKEAGPKSP